MKISFYSTRLLWQKLSFGLLMFGVFLWLAASTSAAPGDLDTTFGSGGTVVTPITGGYLSVPTRVRIQPDGKIVTVGYNVYDYEPNYVPADSFLVRHNADGTLDNSFGTNGLVVQGSNSGEIYFRDFVILPDGKFLVTGDTYYPILTVLYRYTANGTPDATFGTNGVVTTPLGLEGRRIVLQPDGKFVVACGAFNFGSEVYENAVVRYNPNGTLDTTFGTSGITTFSGFNGIGEILVQTDGKLLVAATSYPDIFVLRYTPNGTLDNSFGANGIVQTDVDNQSNYVNGMALQPDGKIIVNGENRISGDYLMSSSIVRYNANGTLDNTLGTNGIVRITEPPSQYYSRDIAFALAIQQNGKILTAGERNNTFAISRYNSNGTIDTSFGTNGVVITPIGNSPISAGIYSIALQTDGKIVAAGSASRYDLGGAIGVGLARYYGDAVTTASRTRFDLDGDGKADFGVFRPSSGTWFVLKSQTGTAEQFQFGQDGDVPLDADFDGDFRADYAVWRPSTGDWWFIRSSNSTTGGANWGTNGDKTVPADYDGDGITDFAVWRPSNGITYIVKSTGGFQGSQWGTNRDIPAHADLNNDGKADLIVFRPSTGTWFTLINGTSTTEQVQFGQNGDIPVRGDIDGDRKADILLWRPTTGEWFFRRSSNLTFGGLQWGANGDRPVPGDYDGDGRTDFGVWRPSNGIHYIVYSTGGFLGVQWGQNDDIPILGAPLP